MARPVGSNGVKIETIISTLREYPNGATTRQLAERMKVAKHTIGSRLSKAANYGTIDRTLYRKGNLGHEAIWQAKK